MKLRQIIICKNDNRIIHSMNEPETKKNQHIQKKKYIGYGQKKISYSRKRTKHGMAWHGMAYLGQRDRLYIVCIEIIHIHKFHKSLSFFSLSIIGCGKPTNVRRLHAHSYKTIIDSKQVD